MLSLILPYAYFILLTGLIIKAPFFRIPQVSGITIPLAFAFKCFMGICMMFIYTNHYKVRYEADIFRYFDDSRVIYDVVWTHPLDFLRIMTGIDNERNYLWVYYNRMICWNPYFTNGVIRLNVIFRFLSGGNFFVHIIFSAFMGLCGLVGLIKTFEYFKIKRFKILAFTILFFPSLSFWTSSPLKETIAICSLGLGLYMSFKGYLHKNYYLLGFGLAVLIPCGFTKPYVLISLVVASLCALLFVFYGKERKLFYVLLFCLCLGGIAMYHMPKTLQNKQLDFYKVAEDSRAGSLMNTFVLDGTWSQLLIKAPIALQNALWQPGLIPKSSLLVKLSCLENFFILALIAVSLFKTRSRPLPWFFWVVFVFVLLNLLMIGYTTPVAGAIVRYRVIALPFLFCLLACLHGIQTNEEQA